MPYLTGDAPGAEPVCRVLYLPDDQRFIQAVNGALLELTYPWNWEEDGDLTAQEAADLAIAFWEDYIASECPVMVDYDIDRSGDTVRLLADGTPDTTVDISDKVDDTGDKIYGELGLENSDYVMRHWLYPNQQRFAFRVQSTAVLWQVLNVSLFTLQNLTSTFWWRMTAAYLLELAVGGVAKLRVNSSGNMNASDIIGVNANTSTSWRAAHRMTGSWIDATDATRLGRGRHYVDHYGGTCEYLRADAVAGGEAKLGFRGVNAIDRPVLTGDVSQETYDLAQALDDLGLVDNQFEVV